MATTNLTLAEIQARMKQFKRASDRLWVSIKYPAVQLQQSIDGNLWKVLADGDEVFLGEAVPAENFALELIERRLRKGYSQNDDVRSGPKQRINFYSDADVFAWYQAQPEGGRAKLINQACRDYMQRNNREAQGVQTLLDVLRAFGNESGDRQLTAFDLLTIVSRYEGGVNEKEIFPD